MAVQRDNMDKKKQKSRFSSRASVGVKALKLICLVGYVKVELWAAVVCRW